jgi:hypothetical protein
VGEIDPAARRRRVVEHFDIGALGANYEAVYRSVLAVPASRPAPHRTGELAKLQQDYAELDHALDVQYEEDLRRLAQPSAPPESRRRDRTQGRRLNPHEA